MSLLTKYRIVLTGFVVGLVLSGLTAFPLTWELGLLTHWIAPYQDRWPGLAGWLFKVRAGLVSNDVHYPFIAYGTDWLAFGHLMIATAYWGPWKDPIRNRWILEWGMICCVAVLPLAFICGPIRSIPLAWTILDCMFGVVGIVPLYVCWRWSKALEAAAR